ncbi:MAG: excinuclease ABC subunit UvrC [Pirellulales bacterium]
MSSQDEFNDEEFSGEDAAQQAGDFLRSHPLSDDDIAEYADFDDSSALDSDEPVDTVDPEEASEAEAETGSEEVVEPTAAELEAMPFGFRRAAEKVRSFPRKPGVYLMKDSAGRVIYVGKAKNLRSRAGSYFLKAAQHDSRTGHWVLEICDIDFLECESEVDSLLAESRLIKDIQPKYNKEQKDDKSFPYLMITTREDFPRVEITRQPRDSGVRLFGPFASAGALRAAMQVLQRIFKFRTCTLDIEENDPRWKWFRPCLLASIAQCTAPCNLRISKDDYRRDIKRLQTFLEGGKTRLLEQLREEMQTAAKNREYEKAAKLRDEIKMLERLDERGDLETHAQPQVFYIDPKKGLAGLRKVLKLKETPRVIEGVDIAHLGGNETVASLVQFIDGLPFKPGYRRYRIRDVKGIDDFRSIHEVVSRRFRRLSDNQAGFPDILLIDGGKGQLNAALAAFRDQQITPPTLLSLAKREEEIFLPGESDPILLSRHSFALRLLQYVRDEAHRFAQHYHHILRSKSQME